MGFLDDEFDIPFKTARRPTREGAEVYTIRAVDWNRAVIALNELRTFAQAGGGGGGVSDGDKGDVVVSGGGSTWTIDTNVVSLSKLAQIASASFLGRVDAGTGNVQVLTGTQATALLDTFTTTAKGLVPAASGGNETTEFLRKDGTWAAVGSGSGTSSVSVTVETANTGAATIALDTVGQIDWIFLGLLSNSTRLSAHASPTTFYMKRDSPGWLLDIERVYAGISLTPLSQLGSLTLTAAATGHTGISNISTTNGWGFHTPGALGNLNWGWRIAVPVPGDGVSRTLRYYGSQFSCSSTFTATLTDGSTSTATNVGSGSATQYHVIDIVYSSDVAQTLVVKSEVSENFTTNSNIKLQAFAIF